MAINPVSHQGYITQLFQPLATGKNQGADQATATDQLDGIINSVKQHSFKISDEMRRAWNLPATVTDLNQFASLVNSRMQKDWESGAEDWARSILENGGTQEEAEQAKTNWNSAFSEGKNLVGAFLTRGDEIVGIAYTGGGFMLSDGAGSSTELQKLSEEWSNKADPGLDTALSFFDRHKAYGIGYVRVFKGAQ